MEGFKINDGENLKIAALLHDIGKFYQRTGDSHSEKYKKYSQDDFGQNGAHAKWSSDFLEQYFNDDIVDLALYHHKHTKSNYPDLCDILRKADHHSASERESSDEKQEVNKTPLISLFSKIVLEDKKKVDEQYVPLNKLSLDDKSFEKLKPTTKNESIDGWNLEPEYKELWKEFKQEFDLIQNKTDFNTLLALLKKYTLTMPSAAYASKSDISLYDHSKTTAALAISRYLFNRDGDVKLTQNDDLDCYLAIEGDISGIQKFIFKISSPQEAQSGMSKRLRGRSLYLSLLCDAIATHIAEELELSQANILFCGGGRFTIIGPNTKTAKEKLAKIKSKINEFFIDEFNAELYLALVSIQCCGKDLGKFGEVTRKLSNKLNEDKKHKFSDNLEDVFKPDVITGQRDTCPVCGMPYISKPGKKTCEICESHEILGQNSVNAEYMIKCIDIFDDFDENSKEYYIINPIKIAYSFFKNDFKLIDKINDLSKKCKKVEVIKLNNTSFLDLHTYEVNDNISFSFSFMGNTVPNFKQYNHMPLYFEHLAQISEGANKLGVLKMDVDNLGLILSWGLKKFYGHNCSISRISSLSSQLDIFFSGFVNNIASDFNVYSKVLDDSNFKEIKLNLQNDEKSEETISVFKSKVKLTDDEKMKLKKYAIPTIHINYSGGDDLLVLGPYDDIICFASELRNKFKEWTADNPSIDLSAGISIVAPKFPIGKAVDFAESYLERSKSCGKNKITLFNEVLPWDNNKFKSFDEIMEFSSELEKYVDNKKLSKGFVYSLLMAWQESFNFDSKEINDEAKWIDENCHKKEFNGFIPRFVYKLRLIKDNKLRDWLMKEGKCFMPWIKIPVSWVSLRLR